jgi:hypothetical protein
VRKIVISMHDSAHAEIHHFKERANNAQSELVFEHLRLPDGAKLALSAPLLDAESALKTAHALRSSYDLDSADSLIVVVDGNIQDAQDDEYFVMSGREYSPADSNYASVAIVSLYYLNASSAFMKKAGKWWESLNELERTRVASDSVLLLILCAVAGEMTGVDYHDDVRGCVMDYCQTPSDIVASLKGGFQFCDEMCRPLLEEDPNGMHVMAIAEQLTKHPFRFQALPTGEFDVFLCHNSKNKQAIRAIANQLRERGLEPWVDVEQLRPGFPWQRVLEDQIEKIRAAAVFVGEDGFGPWQDLEIAAFIRQFVRRNAPVIPVILPAVREAPKLPVFLEGMTWVDFRNNDPDPLGLLIWGITGALAPALTSSPTLTPNSEPVSHQAPTRGLQQPLPSQPDTHSQLVITLHGIRTRGAWQKDLDTELGKAQLVPTALDYGFFRATKMLIPALRRRQVDWFLEQYTHIRAENGNVRPSVVAHSFGTFLVASAMERYQEVEFDHVIFCGSIVSREFAWSTYVGSGRVRRLLNDCGERDRWVRLAAWVIREAGASGALGFEDKPKPLVVERRHPQFSHSDFFYRLNFQKNWIPFLKGGDPQESVLSEKRPTNWKFVIVEASLTILVVVAVALLLYRIFS